MKEHLCGTRPHCCRGMVQELTRCLLELSAPCAQCLGRLTGVSMEAF